MNSELFIKIDELIARHDLLCSKAFTFYDLIKDDPNYDVLPLICDIVYERYKRVKMLEIYSYQNKEVNNELLEQLIDVKIKFMNNLIDNINRNTIGTCLNVIKEFWNDLYIDLKRNEI